jgi:HD-like signal output (HDOD) protein
MRKNIAIIILGITTVLLFVYGLVQRTEMERQLSLTEELNQQLYQCEEIAEAQRMIAEEQRKIAEQQRLMAEMNLMEAKRQRNVAEQASK